MLPQYETNNEEETINIAELIQTYTSKWKLYLLFILLGLIGAYLYNNYKKPLYQANTSFIINEAKQGNGLSLLEGLDEFSLMGGNKTSIENEIEILKSRALLDKVIKENNINVKYLSTHDDIFSPKPIHISFLFDEFNYSIGNIDLHIEDNNGGFLKTRGSQQAFNWNDTITISESKKIVLKPIENTDKLIGNKFSLFVEATEDIIIQLENRLMIKNTSKKNDIISISISDHSPKLAEATLNTLVKWYDKIRIKDKKAINIKTLDFLNNRINRIEQDLQNIESQVSSFKGKNNLTDIKVNVAFFSKSLEESQKRIIEAQTKLELAQYLADFFKNEKDTFSLVPINLGLDNKGLEEITRDFNKLVVEREAILSRSSPSNPKIRELSQKIFRYRSNIQRSLKSYEKSLKISLAEVLKQDQKLQSKIKNIPETEKKYRSIARQQELIEALYVFLLKKKEETSLALAATDSKITIIDRAYSKKEPISPIKSMVYLGALIGAFVLTTLIIYIFELLNNKVHSKVDLERVLGNISYLGDIPFDKTKSDSIISSPSDKSSTAEAVRIVATSLKFTSAKPKGNKIIITSTTSGEGKTYFASNISTILTFSKKKVLLIAADLRKPKTGDYFTNPNPQTGLSSYLSGNHNDMENLIAKDVDGITNFDVIFPGPVPPNPVELLNNGRFDELIKHVEEIYDYIIIDAAPSGLVTDTITMKKLADSYIYVVRANYLDKKLLEIPKNLMQTDKLHNVSFVLNDIDMNKNYGYGYGYGYGEGVKKSWLQQFLKS
ncbi:MAG: polysaccharide biosynthesis tyrosine autokinase [Flavobacteriales bacterium]|jgi:capsular exopolysaccharide synthesis family protein|nr:polysaccharide biosynthesis tyrosine autokinase [Flavobacteriales bacterium]